MLRFQSLRLWQRTIIFLAHDIAERMEATLYPSAMTLCRVCSDWMVESTERFIWPVGTLIAYKYVRSLNVVIYVYVLTIHSKHVYWCFVRPNVWSNKLGSAKCNAIWTFYTAWRLVFRRGPRSDRNSGHPKRTCSCWFYQGKTFTSNFFFMFHWGISIFRLYAGLCDAQARTFLCTGMRLQLGSHRKRHSR